MFDDVSLGILIVICFNWSVHCLWFILKVTLEPLCSTLHSRSILRKNWSKLSHLNGHTCVWMTNYVKSVQMSKSWPIFSRIWSEYGDILRKSPYSVWIRENTDQKKVRIWTLSIQWHSYLPVIFKGNYLWIMYLFSLHLII